MTVKTRRGAARTMMAAVVLGTALAAPPAEARAEPQTVDSISRYCQACWRNARLPADHWPDATQQVFVRLMERLTPAQWGEVLADETAARVEFLRAIDTVKKRSQRTRRGLAIDENHAVAECRVSRDDNRAAVEEIAPRVLSERQRRIFDLTFAGWAVPEIANALGTTEARISDEKYKAIKRMQAALNA